MIVDCKNIDVYHGNQSILKGLTFSISAGQKVAITGESGTGKSTLLNVLAGFTRISSGELFLLDKSVNEENISEIRQDMAWVPQETVLQFDSVHEMIYAPFQFALNKEHKPNTSKVHELFEIFGLPQDLLLKTPSTISGGQKQRIMLISSLLLQKPLLVIDEPTSALDKGNRERITDYILGIENLTVIASTHDKYWMEKSDKIIAL